MPCATRDPSFTHQTWWAGSRDWWSCWPSSSWRRSGFIILTGVLNLLWIHRLFSTVICISVYLPGCLSVSVCPPICLCISLSINTCFFLGEGWGLVLVCSYTKVMPNAELIWFSARHMLSVLCFILPEYFFHYPFHEHIHYEFWQ